MAVTYSTAVKTARLNAVKTAIDGGGGAGKLEIGTAGMATVLVTYTLASPCGTVTDDVLTLSGFPQTEAGLATGTPAEARIRDFADTDVVTGLTVGLADTDIVLDVASINEAQDVTLNASPTITHG